MTVIGWIQILLYCAIIVALTPLLGALHDARVQRRAHVPVAGPAAGRGRALKLAGVDEKQRAALAHLHGRHAAVSCRRLSHSLCADARCKACCRSIRPEQSAVAPDSSFNTAISFITNTNWQNYGGESTMSYLVQMLGLTTRTSFRRRPASCSPSR